MTPHYYENCRIFDAASLFRCGCLNPGRYAWEWSLPGSPRASTAIVTDTDVVRVDDQRITIEWKPCKPTRGAQPLFRCPTCSQRRVRLFSPPGGLWRCRECWDLQYRVWNEGWMARMLRAVAQVGVPLAGSPVDGRVPLSCRARTRTGLERQMYRARVRELLAVAALEVLRKDPPSSAE
jgi:hypothetical protein